MKITLAYPWTDGDGKSYDPDSTVEVVDTLGRLLVSDGKARAAESSTRSSAPKRGRRSSAKTTTPTTSEEG